MSLPLSPLAGQKELLTWLFVRIPRTRPRCWHTLFSFLPKTLHGSSTHKNTPIPIELSKTQAKWRESEYRLNNGVQFRREGLRVVLRKHQIREGNGFGLSFPFVPGRCFCREGRLVQQRWCQRLASGLLRAPSDRSNPRSLCRLWSQCSVQYFKFKFTSFLHLGHSPFRVTNWVLNAKGVFFSLWVGGCLCLKPVPTQFSTSNLSLFLIWVTPFCVLVWKNWVVNAKGVFLS